MISFQVDDMTCGHCVKAVTQAILSTDPAAQVQIDLPTHRVAVSHAKANATALHAAIAAAGYTPVAITTPGAAST
jgi:copper chaperone